uniref:Uncharacterized protein n=1 Tax=viral metagenome TaxID=1070528 RepID=A0A6C0EXQ6_9ZZZZ
MGKSETATASIGIKILLSELILQINETNFDLIKKMLYDGCIEDSNEYYNEVYKKIVGYGEYDNELPKQYNKCQKYLIKEFKNGGSYYKSKFSSEIKPDLSNGSLSERYLLVPIKKILETERWGYERYGINSISRPLDFDLSVNLKEYEEIQNFNIIFMVKQHSG